MTIRLHVNVDHVATVRNARGTVYPDPVFAAMSPVRTPSGLVAIATRHPSSASEVCSVPDALVLVAIDVQDPGNVGALVRTAEAGGMSGMFVTGASANPFSWKAIRGSMGSTLRLPVVTVTRTAPAATVVVVAPPPPPAPAPETPPSTVHAPPPWHPRPTHHQWPPSQSKPPTTTSAPPTISHPIDLPSCGDLVACHSN